MRDEPGPTSDAVHARIRALGAARLLRRRREWVAASLAVVFLSLLALYRIGVAKDARWPGHADPAFYYDVAQNIVAGKGPTIDYVWHFLDGTPPLPHYAFDYWLPMPSWLMSVALRVSNSVTSALMVTIIMAMLYSAGTYLLAKALTRSTWVPAAAAVVVAVQPVISVFSMQLEGPLFLGAFGTLGLAAAVSARRHRWLWPVAGLLAGAANLSRSEGLLLAITVGIAALADGVGRRALVSAASAVGGYLVAMLPLYVMSEHYIGHLMPPASSTFPYIQNYEDLFALHVDTSIGALFPGGFLAFFTRRLTAFNSELGTAFGQFYVVDVVVLLVLIGAGLSRRPVGQQSRPGDVTGSIEPARQWWQSALRSRWLPPVGMALMVVGFYTIVLPTLSISGAKWIVLFMPAVVIGALIQLARIRVRPAIRLVIVLALVGLPLLTFARTTRGLVFTLNDTGAQTLALQPVLAAEQACLGRPLVLMTRNPWEITLETGFPTVMIPQGSLEDILTVAARYRATDIQLDSHRNALSDIKTLSSASGPLRSTAYSGPNLIYRISSQTTGSSC